MLNIKNKMPDKKYYRAFFLESNASANTNAYADTIRTATNTDTDGTGAKSQNNK